MNAADDEGAGRIAAARRARSFALRVLWVCQSRTKMGPLPGVIPGHERGFLGGGGGMRLGARGPKMPDACQGALAAGQFMADCVVWGSELALSGSRRSRKLWPFISRMWTWWVRRSRMAPVRALRSEHLGPFVEGQVRGDDDRAALALGAGR